MGEVHLAEDTRLGRKVALKLLPASYQYDLERRERFVREARAASLLRSPNVAAIYDFGESENAMFIAMEYVEGELLSKRLENGPLISTWPSTSPRKSARRSTKPIRSASFIEILRAQTSSLPLAVWLKFSTSVSLKSSRLRIPLLMAPRWGWVWRPPRG